MKSFEGKIAVITGGGSGMGREMALQLVAMGCDVAICDVFSDGMAETKQLCLAQARQGTRLSTFPADVSVEDQVLSFVEAVKRDLDTDRIHLLFNNAGIGEAAALSTAAARNRRRPSMSAGMASISARGPSCRC
jgi:NAD(P)-dependent dehydrogenase (short-subunit alcohol dehydrogenase family)